jgi:hypothetical protein
MARHIAIYLRVSNGKKNTKSQEPNLRAWTKAFANGRTVRIYRETGQAAAWTGPTGSALTDTSGVKRECLSRGSFRTFDC